MNPDEREQMNWLCERIQIEENPHAFMNLVEQSNELPERRESVSNLQSEAKQNISV
jgi:hypothetical protein